MKYLIVIICIAVNLELSAQELRKDSLIGYWLSSKSIENLKENSPVYSVFTETTNYLLVIFPENLGGISFSQSFYGFYNSCDLPSISSLKDKGKYYFEVDSTDFEGNDDEIKASMQNSCAELHIFNKGKETMMNIYYSSRQQYATYKRVRKLPDNIVKYLNSKGIKLPSETKNKSKHQK